MDEANQFKPRWLSSGQEAFSAMLQCIDEAKVSIRFEMYIFRDDAIGHRFRDALTTACRRGVRVKILLDGFGSVQLPASFWDELEAAGGEFRRFNRLELGWVAVRDHRKVLVCDERMAVVGGLNVGAEYVGDGVSHGWRDLGLMVAGSLARQLLAAFDEMFARASDQKKSRPRRFGAQRESAKSSPGGTLLLSSPGRRHNLLKRTLREDLEKGRSVQIMSAYFLPSWTLRNELMRIARRGGKVQLLLAGKSDVPLAQRAARRLYERLLVAGIEIFEYQPQILHGKLIRIDDTVYAGSMNLDTRGLQINYELMVRITNHELACQARDIFRGDLAQARQLRLAEWRASRGLLTRLRERWAYLLLTRLDLFLARARPGR